MHTSDPTPLLPPADLTSKDAFLWMAEATDGDERARRIAAILIATFDGFYSALCAIPALAKAAFENMVPAESLALSRRRLGMYSRSINELAASLNAACPGLAEDSAKWTAIEPLFLGEMSGRYEEDVAVAYFHSVRRIVFDEKNWRPIDYHFRPQTLATDWLERSSDIVRVLPGADVVTPEMVAAIVDIAGFAVPFRSPAEDAVKAAARINQSLGLRPGGAPFRDIKVLNAGFYRNRGAYIVGLIELADAGRTPLLLALENSPAGIFIDAVLTREADAHNIFSSTLANFHVTNARYHEIVAFLHAIMPGRPLGLHYSTIGYNHIAKIAVMEELSREIARNRERFSLAAGFRGSVAIGLSAPSSAYVLKVIRDTPAAHYKWEAYPGVEAVLAKYARVHEIDRTGSMLDNILFRRVSLDADWFAPEVLEELTSVAANSVALRDGKLEFHHLIVQPRMIPIPVFLRTASTEAAEVAIVNLGHCIKNNAAANIFNRDLDARNYGVSRFGKVFLYDYDAVEALTDIKVRTNTDREEGEEDVPNWFFEDGIIFLPEEIESGLAIDDRHLRRVFRENHPDLLTTGYWLGMQRALRKGWVPRLTVYPVETRI